jgi:hypothetical protein
MKGTISSRGFNSIPSSFLLVMIASERESVLEWLLTVGFAFFVVLVV